MKKSARMLLFSLLLGLLLTGFGAAAALADNVAQTGAEKNAITVRWNKKTFSSSYYSVLNYKVKVKEYNAPSNAYKTVATLSPSVTSQKIKGLKAGTKYTVQVTCDYKYTSTYSNYTYTDNTVGSLYEAKTLPGNVTNLKQTRWWYWINKLEVQWDKQDGVDGYEYVCLKHNGKTQQKGTNRSYSGNSATINKVSNEMIYTVKVRAFTTINGKKYYGSWTKPIYCFTQPRITKIKVSGKKLAIKWRKVSGATGYAIYVSTKPTSGYKKVKTVSAKKGSIKLKKFKGKKFKKSKNYYVYVQTLKKVDGRMNTSGQLYYWQSKGGGYGYLN